MKLDKTDLKLLRILQQDSKKTNKQLASQLHLSVTAIYERIKKLERSGIINKYVALVTPEKVGRDFVVFCHIKLSQHTIENLSAFEKQVAQLDEVLECFHVSGEYDYLLKVVVADMPAFRHFMVNKLTTLQHIGNTQSSFTISTIKNTTALTL
ncbi:Lrp/AsnC family transcriptional regulator [Altibacter sp. HG106]|uniref:Lrp/AsnC family transcriptional regulator n=1 Tax=Altibacter sp. HG106 TaxID=3023937 RepID=UPI00234FE13B|nr:Lrp/AsnC family transcriptional regulator [Altibacter sp. HG106]MDC7995457.1 Lrp/AsnC family transcriptional regulator [Altibacter sp. HG106]